MKMFIVRIGLTLLLLYGVWLETGPCTAGCLFLVAAYIELQTWLTGTSAKNKRELKKCSAIVGNMLKTLKKARE